MGHRFRVIIKAGGPGVLTNAHVVNGADTSSLPWKDGRDFTGKVSVKMNRPMAAQAGLLRQRSAGNL